MQDSPTSTLDPLVFWALVMGYQKARLGAEPKTMQERPSVRRCHVTDVKDEHGNVVGSTGSAALAAPVGRRGDCGHTRRQVSLLAAAKVRPNGL